MTALAAERNAGEGDPLRILFIPEVEIAPTSERTPLLLRTLRARHDVVGLRPTWDRFIYDPRRSKWPRFLLYILDKAVLGVRGLVAARRARAQVVFCETAHHAVSGLVAARLVGARCVWDSHGNGKTFYESLGKSRLAVRMVTALERFLGRRVDGLITVSAADAAAYVDMGLPPAKIHVIPLSVSLSEIDARVRGSDVPPNGPESPPVLLFFGSFSYEPNREALDFVNDVLAPRLERDGVRCEIRIAGRDIPSIRFHPFVRSVGFVPDIYAQIRAASLCIVPVRRGVGVLTKVLDSMAVGTPLVLSRFAASGIPEVRHGVHAYVAASGEEFIRFVEEALDNPGARLAMSREARRLVERRFDWDAYLEALEAILVPRQGPMGGEVHAG